MSSTQYLWEVSGIIDKRDRRKASSLTHKGDLMEFRFFCKHLVLANGATDLYNELRVKGEHLRYTLRSIRELEDKIRDDLARLQKDPLLIVGCGLSAADAILLAQKHHIRIIHVIRRSVHDPDIIFNKLPKKIYPEYHLVYEQMQRSSKQQQYIAHLQQQQQQQQQQHHQLDAGLLKRPLSQSDLLNHQPLLSSSSSSSLTSPATTVPSSTTTTTAVASASTSQYVLYDECQVKQFTSKRTCILASTRKSCQQQQQQQHQQQQQQQHEKIAAKCLHANFNRHLHLQKHHHNQRQLDECDEECEMTAAAAATAAAYNNKNGSSRTGLLGENEHHATQYKCAAAAAVAAAAAETEIKISYACVLIGYSPDLDFLPPGVLANLAVDTKRPLDTKDNPIDIEPFTHESSKFSDLYAMGPLVGDNFVRYFTHTHTHTHSVFYFRLKTFETQMNCEKVRHRRRSGDRIVHN